MYPCITPALHDINLPENPLTPCTFNKIRQPIQRATPAVKHLQKGITNEITGFAYETHIKNCRQPLPF